MKRRKNKGAVVAIVASLSTVSLVSVGFAAWLITGGDTASATGEIDVETVEDQRYLLRADNNGAPDSGNTGITFADNIVFGPKENTDISNPWLTYGTVGQVAPKMENLQAKVKIWLGNGNEATVDTQNGSHSLLKGGQPILKLYQATTLDGDYATCQSSGYVAALPTPTIAATDASLSSEINGIIYKQFEITIDFAWGSHFGSTSTNPYTFYNSHAADDAYTGALTSDTTFQAGKTYYTRSGSEGSYTYSKATVTVGATVTSNMYYEAVATFGDDANTALTALESLNDASYSVVIKTGSLID